MNDNKITAADALQRAHDEIVRLHKSVMKFNGIESDGADNSVAEEIRTAIAASAQDTSATPGMHARVVSITPGVGHITLDLGRAIPEWADLSCTVTIVEHPSACIATLAEPAQAPSSIDQQVAGAPVNGGPAGTALIDLIEQAQKIAPSLATRVYELTPVQVAWIVGKSKPLAVGSDTTGTKLNDLVSYERNARGSDGEPPYSVEDFYFAGDVKRLVETILAPSGDGDRHGARQLAIGRAVERACNELPPGFEVEVMLERDAGTVTLYCPEGYGTDECPDADTFDERINHAIDAAIKRTSTC